MTLDPECDTVSPENKDFCWHKPQARFPFSSSTVDKLLSNLHRLHLNDHNCPRRPFQQLFPGLGPDPGPCVLLEAGGHWSLDSTGGHWTAPEPSWSWLPRDRVLRHLWVCPAVLSPGAFTVGTISFGSKWSLFPPGSPLLVAVLPVSDLTSGLPWPGGSAQG